MDEGTGRKARSVASTGVLAVTAAVPAPEGTVVWKKSELQQSQIPDVPIGDRDTTIIFGESADKGYHVRLVNGDLEVRLWAGRLSVHPTGAMNTIVIRREA